MYSEKKSKKKTPNMTLRRAHRKLYLERVTQTVETEGGKKMRTLGWKRRDTYIPFRQYVRGLDPRPTNPKAQKILG